MNSNRIPAQVARTLTARAAYLAATCTNLIAMSERAVAQGEVEGARVLLAELAPYAAEQARFRAAGWAA